MDRIEHKDGLEFLKTIDDNSISLILTDPPYIISHSTGMNTHYNNIEDNKKNGVEYMKTEEQWKVFIEKHSEIKYTETQKKDYLKYGSIYGTKYSVQTDYGEWDSSFTMNVLNNFLIEYYKKLKNGGTLIIFFDLWKISELKVLLENNKFKQIRFIEWIKTNPQPLNSKVNYLTNSREIALTCIKGSKPTFNSEYDNGIYNYPIQGGKTRSHPTQKNTKLFEDLIKKHSNENDIVLDTFLGSGTTAVACKNTKRIIYGCEIDKNYYDKIIERIKN